MASRMHVSPLLLFSTCCLVALLALTGAHSPAARAQAPEPAAPGEAIKFQGPFSLTQRDGPNCGFSGAPYTTGEIELWADFATGSVAGELKNGLGSGWRRGLRCGDNRGDMFWTASYSARLTGTVDPTNGELKLSGTLTGRGTVDWDNCSDEGCPGPPFDTVWKPFPVSVAGELGPSTRIGEGDIYVSAIGLPTQGEWSAVGPRLVAVAQGKVEKNGKPMPKDTPTSVIDIDDFKLIPGEESAALVIYCALYGDLADPTWAILYQAISGSERDSIVVLTKTEYEKICGEDQAVSGQGPPSALSARQPLGLELQQGAIGATTLDPAAGVSIETEVATLTSTGKSHSVVSYDPATQASQIQSFQGIAQVKPKGPGATPIYLEPGQQVEVTDEGAGPIVAMEKVFVPLVQ